MASDKLLAFNQQQTGVMAMREKVAKLLLIMICWQFVIVPQPQFAQVGTNVVKREKLKKLADPYSQVIKARQKNSNKSNYSRLLEPVTFNQLSNAGQYAVTMANNQPSMKKLVDARINRASSPDTRINQKFSQADADQSFLLGDANSNVRVNDVNRTTAALTQSESSVAVNGNNVVVSFNDINEGSGYGFSSDGGQTFTHSIIPDPANGINIGDGVVSFGPNGELYYATLTLLFESTGLKSIIGVAKSTDNGATFSPVVDASTTAGNNFDFQDKEWLVVDKNLNSPFKGNVYVSWTNFSNDVSINFARSIDGGQTYQPPIRVSDEANLFGVQGSMPAVAPNGDIYIAYFRLADTPNLADSQTIAIVKSTDGGATFSKPTVISKIFNTLTLTGGLDIFGVRTNSFPSIAVDQNGIVHVVYGATNSKNSLPTGVDRSDVFYLRSVNGGQTFNSAIKLNDDNTTTSQSIPSIAVAADGTVGVRWWDRRNDPVFDSMTDVYMATSTNGGATFGANFQVTNQNWTFGGTESRAATGYHGDYDGITAFGNDFFVVWSDERNENADVYFAKVPANYNSKTPDFSVTAKNFYGLVVGGNKVNFPLQIANRNGFSDNISLSATSSVNGLSYSFSPNSTRAGQTATLTVSAAASVPAGTYLIVVTASSGQMVRRTNLRLTVFSANYRAGLPTNITNNKGDSNLQMEGLLVDNKGTIHVCYVDNTSLKVTPETFLPFDADAFYMQSTDGGKTFSTPMLLPTRSRNVGFPGAPRMAIDNNNGNIYLVFTGSTTTPGSEENAVFLIRSTDGGRSFSQPVLVNTEKMTNRCLPTSMTIGVDPAGTVVIAEGNNLCFVNDFDEDLSTRVAIFVVRSFDQGQTFNLPERVSPIRENPVFGSNLRIAFDSQGSTYVLYPYQRPAVDFSSVDFGVNIVSALKGKSFTKPSQVYLNRDVFKIIQNNSEILLVDTPQVSLAIDKNDNIYASFEAQPPPFNFPQRTDVEIYLAKSSDKGRTFDGLVNVSNDRRASFVGYTNVLVDVLGNVNVAWRSLDGFLIASSRDGGKTFGSSTNISGKVNPFVRAFDTLGLVADNKRNLLAFWNSGITSQFEVYLCTIPLSTLGQKGTPTVLGNTTFYPRK